MDRLYILKSELEQVETLKCLSFDLKDSVRQHYRHEIERIEGSNEQEK